MAESLFCFKDFVSIVFFYLESRFSDVAIVFYARKQELCALNYAT